MAEVTIEVRQFLTCRRCGYRKIHVRDTDDAMQEAMVKTRGIKCEGDCAYKGEDHWRASFLEWTDTVRVTREWTQPVVLGKITDLKIEWDPLPETVWTQSRVQMLAEERLALQVSGRISSKAWDILSGTGA